MKDAQWQINDEEVLAASTLSPPPYPKQQPLHTQQGYAASNHMQEVVPAIPLECLIKKEEVTNASTISPSPNSNQRSPHPKLLYVDPNPPQPGQQSFPAEWEIDTVEAEAVAAPTISLSSYPKQCKIHPK